MCWKVITLACHHLEKMLGHLNPLTFITKMIKMQNRKSMKLGGFIISQNKIQEVMQKQERKKLMKKAKKKNQIQMIHRELIPKNPQVGLVIDGIVA
jgi:hypothetical protein